MSENWYSFTYLSDELPTTSACEPRVQPAVPHAGAPFAEPIVAGKGGRAYAAHSYPTKVPPEAIEPFIRHYTQPGDVVLDPFCGSGMTGLAARSAGRRAVLNDLGALALHLAFNHTTPCAPDALRAGWQRVQRCLEAQELQIYGINCTGCHSTGTLRYMIWSDVYECPSCATEVPLWKHALDRARGTVKRLLVCPACEYSWQKTAAVRKRSEPAWAAYTCSCSRGLQERELSDAERLAYTTFPAPDPGLFWPRTEVSADREMYRRSALHLQGIRTVADFYTARNLTALALLWQEIEAEPEERVRFALAFAFTNTAWHGTRMRRFNARGGHRPLTGTLYIPQLSAEANVFQVFDHKIGQLERFYAELEQTRGDQLEVTLHRGSATRLDWLADSSVDYIFTDPPFGSNIFYADCNLIAEAWLGSVTDTALEAVVNRSRTTEAGGKNLHQYQVLLTEAFVEMHRVLKPDRWATVVFQSSDGEVWRTISEAAADAGFELHEANVLDKVQQSMKGYKGRNGSENVASFDIVLSLRKRATEQITAPRLLTPWELDQQILEVVEQHLFVTAPDSERERTLPFLYSLVVRDLLNRGHSVSGLTMEGVRRVLSEALQEQNGCWFLPASESAVG